MVSNSEPHAAAEREHVDPRETLDTMFSPISIDTFRTDYFGRSALYLPGPRDKFLPWMSRRRFDRLVEEPLFSRWNREGAYMRALLTPPGGGLEEHIIGPGDVAGALANGKTICVNNLHAGSPQLRRLVTALQGALRSVGRARINAYVSRKQGGLRTHIDARHVLVVQVEGTKRWRFSERPGLAFPTSNVYLAEGNEVRFFPDWQPGGEALRHPDDMVWHEVVLSPGDLLYLPPGTWHAACALEECFALNLAVEYVTPIDVITRIAAGAMLEDPRWRAGLFDSRAEFRSELRQCMKDMASLLERWSDQPQAFRRFSKRFNEHLRRTSSASE